jgi:hypothetical protein
VAEEPAPEPAPAPEAEVRDGGGSASDCDGFVDPDECPADAGDPANEAVNPAPGTTDEALEGTWATDVDAAASDATEPALEGAWTGGD